jgi:16S rRNA (cytosine967-C5)-methyltransferase
VLDLCAGSGGKALAIAAALGNRGSVLATDVHRRRLQELRQQAARAGVHNVQAGEIGEVDVPAAVAEFARHADRILVDAPCSGTGSWRRRPEARWNVRLGDLAALRATQERLLAMAAGWLRPGARLVYATCSLLRDENEEPIAALLAQRPELEVVRLAEVLSADAARPIADASGTFLSLRPDRHGCDGLFAAIVRRRRGESRSSSG